MTRAKKLDMTRAQRATTMVLGTAMIAGSTVVTAVAIPVSAAAGLVVRGAKGAAAPYAELGKRVRKAWRELRAL